jgi:hypothetical protein
MKTKEYYLDTKTGKIKSREYTPLVWYEIILVLVGLLLVVALTAGTIISLFLAIRTLV